MNRAEKRHRQKLARKAAKQSLAAPPVAGNSLTSGNLAIDPSRLVDDAMELHRAGRLPDA